MPGSGQGLSQGSRDGWILAAVVALVMQASLFVAVLTSQARGSADFRALYAAGAIVRSGHAQQLYDDGYEAQVQNVAAGKRSAALPFLYPPFAALIFVPLAGIPFCAAFALFTVVNLACVLACAWLLVRTGPLPQHALLFAIAFSFGFTPLGFALLQGQISVLLLLALCLAQLALESGRPFPAGICVALTLAKFHIALPLALLFLLWRQWRFSQGFLVGAAALLGVSTMMVGPSGLIRYCVSLGSLASRASATFEEPPYRIFPAKMPNLHGISNLILGNGAVALAVMAILSLALVAWAGSRKPSLPAAVVVAILVSYHLHPHDLTLLLLPLSVSVKRLLSSPSGSEQTVAQAALTLLLLLPPVYLVLEAAAMMPLLTAPLVLLLGSLTTSRHSAAPVHATLHQPL